MKKFLRNEMGLKGQLPEKVLMFGEGNFLRAFVGTIVDRLNKNANFNGGITALQGIDKGLCEIINNQEGLYTVIERGFKGSAPVENFSVISCINRCVNPYKDYNEFLEIAKNPELTTIISNTTEFGICYAEGEGKDVLEHKNYPAKLTDFLYKRYKFFNGNKDKGLTILPCELIDRNGDKLKQFVLKYAKEWQLEDSFILWLNHSNIFGNTLVDRIVSGYPRTEAEKICEKLGYQDNLLDVCEPFLLWVIEGDKKLLEKLPFDKCGLDIIVTDNLEPYRTRKVRILNGAHTMSVLAGHLSGFEFVEQLVKDPTFIKYIQKGIFKEIIPSTKGENLEKYANDVLERFKNPYLNHRLLSISLNSVSKFKTRVLPSIKDYISNNGKAPEALSFSFAALIAFYKKGINCFVNDEKQYIDRLSEIFAKNESIKNVVTDILSETLFWGEDLSKLNGLCEIVTKYYTKIETNGIKNALESAIDAK